THAMQEVIRSGTARSTNSFITPDYHLAGKTGTSNDQRDSWFAGFSGNYLGVVWMGRDDNEKTPLTGASGALRVWNQTFSKLALQPLELNQPADVEWVWVDPLQQVQTDAECPGSIEVPMRIESIPEQTIPCNPGGRVFNWFRGLVNPE
ncbi:MAG: penicillin-binding protein 1B, partial [Pseudomonadota bacterium]